MSEPTTASQPEEQPAADRGSNRSHRPASTAFKNFVMSQWAPRAELNLEPSPAAPYTVARRAALSERLPGKRLVVPAGSLKPRSNDTDYRFRPHSAFARSEERRVGEQGR